VVNEGFYVSIRSGSRRGLALGPYASEPQAREDLDLAFRLAEQVDPWAGFYQFGTCKVTTSRRLPTGRLNHLAQAAPATSPPAVVAYHHRHPASEDVHPGHEHARGRGASATRRAAPVDNPLYLIVLDGIVYEGYRDGRPFTLVDAMRQVYGTRGVTICRLDPGDVLVPVVTNAGSASQVVHAPTGQRIRRRPRPQRYTGQPPQTASAGQAASTNSQPPPQATARAAARPGPPGQESVGTDSHPTRAVPRPAAGTGGRVPPPRPGTPARGR
jgi:hypothetical protein